MILEKGISANRRSQSRTGHLLLNGIDVGEVLVRGHDDSWTFGEFSPGPGFAEFAPLFGAWSLLMHADDAGEKLSSAAAQELRVAEWAIDSLRATILLDSPVEQRQLRQLNLDGALIEWKE